MSTLPAPLRSELLECRARDGTVLRARRWRPAEPEACVFYLHGIQSHSGWLEPTARLLTAHGVELVAFDRRGAGRSDGARGDAPDARTLLDDAARTLRRTRSCTGRERLTVVGQSFGGSLAAALRAEGMLAGDHLVLCAPALGQQRHRHSPERLAALRAGRDGRRRPLGLDLADYSDDPERLAFMTADPLLLTAVTGRMRAAMVGLEDRYMRPARWPGEEPVDLVLPSVDRIIRLDVAERVLRERGVRIREHRFAPSAHYLEFSPRAADYAAWLAAEAVRRA